MIPELTENDLAYLAAVKKHLANGDIKKARNLQIADTYDERSWDKEIKKKIGMTKFRINPLGAFVTERARVLDVPPGLTVRQWLEIMRNGDCGES
jgi:hypothetical protein